MRRQPPVFVGLVVVCDGVGLGFGVEDGGFRVGLGAGAEDDVLVVGCGLGAALVLLVGAVAPLPGLALVPGAVRWLAVLWPPAPRLWLALVVGLGLGLADGVVDVVELVAVDAAA